MAISAKDVMALRKKSGLGMMECKKALEETNGDTAAAEQLLRERGLAKMDGRTDRAASEGRIAAAVSGDGSKAAIVEVNTETDFTASNDSFVAACQEIARLALNSPAGEIEKSDAIQSLVDDLRITTKENASFARGCVLGEDGTTVGAYVHHNGKVGALVHVRGDASPELMADLCMHVTAIVPTPLGITDEDVPADVLAKEREVATAQAIDSGKPANIAEKIVEGKMRKFLEDNTLLKQTFVKDDKKSVQEILPDGVSILAFARYELGETGAPADAE